MHFWREFDLAILTCRFRNGNRIKTPKMVEYSRKNFNKSTMLMLLLLTVRQFQDCPFRVGTGTIASDIAGLVSAHYFLRYQKYINQIFWLQSFLQRPLKFLGLFRFFIFYYCELLWSPRPGLKNPKFLHKMQIQ